MPEVASMGASVSIVDFDRDGWPDIYVTNSARAARTTSTATMHDGTFHDVAGEMGIADVNQAGTGVSMGAVWGDYDNDGYEDLFSTSGAEPELFHNDHGHGFTRVTERRLACRRGSMPTPQSGLTTTATACSTCSSPATIPKTLDLWHLETTRMMPESFEYAKNGGRKYLLPQSGQRQV